MKGKETASNDRDSSDFNGGLEAAETNYILGVRFKTFRWRRLILSFKLQFDDPKGGLTSKWKRFKLQFQASLASSVF